MGKTSNLTEKVKLKDLKKVGRGKPSESLTSVSGLIIYSRLFQRMCLSYGIKENTLYVLMLLFELWMGERKGLTIRGMCMAMYGRASGAHCTLMHEKKDILVSLGLVEQLGLASGKFKLYGPTVKAENDLRFFVDRVNSESVKMSPDASLIEGFSVAI